MQPAYVGDEATQETIIIKGFLSLGLQGKVKPLFKEGNHVTVVIKL